METLLAGFLAFVTASRWGLVLVVAGAAPRAAEEETCWEGVVVDRGPEFCVWRCGCRVSVGIFLDVGGDWQWQVL